MTKIMLVEDDNSLREIYEARLAAEGYQIVSAKDGEEALAVAAKERPELVISDVMMPKISGFEMLDILRNTDGLKNVKVIMLTALGQSEDKTRADALGADRYLVKSQVTLEDIVNAAGELVNGETKPAAPPPAAPVVTPPSPVAPAAEPAAPIAVSPPPTTTTSQPVPEPTPNPVPVSEPPITSTPTPEPTAPAAPEPTIVPPEPAPVPEPPVVTEPATEPQDEAAAAVAEAAEVEVTPSAVEVAPEPSPAAVPEIPVSESEPTSLAEEEAYMQSQIDSFVKADPDTEASESDKQLAAAGSVISNSAAPAVEPVEPPSIPVAEEVPTPEAPPTPETAGGIEPPSHKNKIIQPLSNPNAKPDINTLLAIEEAKEAAAQAQPAAPDSPPKPPIDPNSIAL